MKNKELQEYRLRLLMEIEKATAVFAETCLAVADPHISHDGWTVHQLVAHTRDVQVHVYGMRIRRAAQEDKPAFENFDGDEWMEAHYQRDEPLEQMLDSFSDDVTGMLEMLRAMPDEGWSRLSLHAIQGELTLQIWVERALAHIREHLETVTAK